MLISGAQDQILSQSVFSNATVKLLLLLLLLLFSFVRGFTIIHLKQTMVYYYYYYFSFVQSIYNYTLETNHGLLLLLLLLLFQLCAEYLQLHI